jgi:predicted amidohydrolase
MGCRIGAVQAQDIQGDTSGSWKVIKQAMDNADREGIDLLCFPECFLQGYTLDAEETEERALDLTSPEFKAGLGAITVYKVTIVLGVIEKDTRGYYNTAVVIQQGAVLGKYRKVHLFEHNFQPGDVHPVFVVNGLRFGINICYDARFPEGAAQLTAQGATVILYPLNNRLPSNKAIAYRDKHIPNLVERAKENGCWVISSDVVARDSTHTGYGCTAIVDPDGTVVARVEELAPGMVNIELP